LHSTTAAAEFNNGSLPNTTGNTGQANTNTFLTTPKHYVLDAAFLASIQAPTATPNSMIAASNTKKAQLCLSITAQVSSEAAGAAVWWQTVLEQDSTANQTPPHTHPTPSHP
jgi:hypothetical protein